MKATCAAHEPNQPAALPLLILLLLFILVFVLFMYTFLHESGHALAGLFFGQTLTEFDVNFLNFSAHVNMIGHLTQAQSGLQSIAGAGLPLLIWLAFVSLVPRQAVFSLEVLKLAGSMAVLNTLLPWIAIPILHLFGKAPSDDVTNFLRYSQMPPLLLVFIAIIVYVGGWVLFLSRIDGLQSELRLFRAMDHQTLTAGSRTAIPVMAGIMAGSAVLIFAFNTSAARNSLDKYSPPEGFASVAQIDLSTRAYSAETLARFSLDKPAQVGVFIVIHDIDTTYFDLQVTGSDGYHSIVLHGEAYNASQDGGLWEENLSPGTYQLVLTSHQSAGTAAIYLRTP